MSEPILDEAWPVRSEMALPNCRITVEYREVGPGVENVEVMWDNAIPDAASLVRILRALIFPVSTKEETPCT